jgi:hypothetical protein
MSETMMNQILAGAIAMASLTASLFFLRFWKTTRDRFFLFFALAFFLEGVNRIVLAPTAGSGGDDLLDYAFYLLRLVSYGLILFAILDKNRPHGKDR